MSGGEEGYKLVKSFVFFLQPCHGEGMCTTEEKKLLSTGEYVFLAILSQQRKKNDRRISQTIKVERNFSGAFRPKSHKIARIALDTKKSTKRYIYAKRIIRILIKRNWQYHCNLLNEIYVTIFCQFF